MKTIPLTLASKKNQIPRSKLNKGCKCLYKENYKLLKKEIEEDYRRWKGLPCP
jgi:septation ring formation regulator EzrA